MAKLHQRSIGKTGDQQKNKSRFLNRNRHMVAWFRIKTSNKPLVPKQNPSGHILAIGRVLEWNTNITTPTVGNG